MFVNIIHNLADAVPLCKGCLMLFLWHDMIRKRAKQSQKKPVNPDHASDWGKFLIHEIIRGNLQKGISHKIGGVVAAWNQKCIEFQLLNLRIIRGEKGRGNLQRENQRRLFRGNLMA